ncbi:hypothetical protein AMK28_24405 [Streptomyces sp. CB02115]|nr:hypothetical protein AMK28_24405 [Streptomyces sp. CB02115]
MAQPCVLVVREWLLQRKGEKPACEGEASVLSVALDVVVPRIAGFCWCLQKQEGGSSWMTGVGMWLALHGNLSDDRGCQQTGFLGDLSKDRLFQSFA